MLKENTNKITIREATEADSGLILEFIKGIAEYEKLSDEVVASEDSIKRSLFGDDKVAYALIADYEGKPAAYALYFYNYSTFLAKAGIYLEELFVKPEFRSKGLGKALFMKVAEIAKDKGCGRFEWAVLDWNEPAIEFYKRHGAKAMDQWVIYRMTEKDLAKL